MRSGTENVSGIVGFARAVELAVKNRVKNELRIGKLRDKLVRGVLGSCKGSWLNGSKKNRLYNNAHFGFNGIEGESLVLRLDAMGIAASTGSACSSTSLKASRVLLAIGLTPVQAHGSLRMTLSEFNTEKEVDYVVRKVGVVASSLQEITCVE
jgi:cysteine desulfurase